MLPYQWMKIPPEVRASFALKNGMKASGVSSVILGGSPQVITDGYTTEDLEAVTRDSILAFLGIEDRKQTDETLLNKLIKFKAN